MLARVRRSVEFGRIGLPNIGPISIAAYRGFSGDCCWSVGIPGESSPWPWAFRIWPVCRYGLPGLDRGGLRSGGQDPAGERSHGHVRLCLRQHGTPNAARPRSTRFLPGFNFQNGYSYDAASNRKTLTAPDGSTNTYNYDSRFCRR